ncbi:MAG: M1 family aminopeptidase [Chloroflexota bacterium]
MSRRLFFSLFIWTLLLTPTGCAPAPSVASFPTFVLVTQDPNASPTPTPFQPSLVNATPLPTFTLPPPATNTPEPTVTPLVIPTTALPSVNTSAPPITSTRTNYILNTTIDFDTRTIKVDETIRYYNNTGATLNDIVLAVQPNRYSNCFLLNSVAQDNTPLSSYTVNDQRMTITLPAPLPPGTAATFTINFDLFLPVKRSESLFGYDFNQINLVDWYPFIVPYSGGWVLHDPMPFGEHLVYDASDIEVNIKAAPEIIIAASAPAEANGEWTRYRLYGARTFALSASDEFLMDESAVGAVVIRSYYFAGYEGAGAGMLRAAVNSVALFDVKFAPYPYASLAVVQTDIHDGQEYDGLVFLATDFYGQYGGSAKSNLVTIGVHEIAHQWWFGLVGSDQALEPWLDEAMSVYSERIFYEWSYPNYGDWWWQFRVDYFGPSGYVDTPIYSGGTFRAYTNAVYLNGAHFIEELRWQMGDDNFYRFLKDYAARYSRGSATSYDFFAVAREHSSADISDLINAYFQGDY